MPKSFKARLAELERLEAVAAAEQTARTDQGLPDVDAMSDGELLGEVALGLRNGWLLDGRGNQPPGCYVLGLYVNPTGHGPRVSYYRAVVARAAPLIAAHPGPFIPLAAWEVQDAIRLLDSGRVDVQPGWVPAVEGLRGSFYRLRLDRCAYTPGTDGDQDTIRAVNHAVALWAWQLGYPQVGDWEMTELHEWRAWLVALLEPAAG